jgi:uncharacterized membrane protein YdfJ with MMPL/SSD domain
MKDLISQKNHLFVHVFVGLPNSCRRIQESYEVCKDTKIAVATGIQGSARAVSMAAIVLAIVMGAFISSRTSVLKMVGLGVALSIVIDATIVRCFLVPGVMSLLGKWNWWAPAPLQRMLVKLNLRERSELPIKSDQTTATVAL